MAKILSITKARDELPTMVDKANRLLEEYIITVNGDPKAVIVSHEEYESLKETLDILSEPGALEEIKQAEKELAEGSGQDWEEVKKELRWDV